MGMVSSLMIQNHTNTFFGLFVTRLPSKNVIPFLLFLHVPDIYSRKSILYIVFEPCTVFDRLHSLPWYVFKREKLGRFVLKVKSCFTKLARYKQNLRRPFPSSSTTTSLPKQHMYYCHPACFNISYEDVLDGMQR